jgi:hypothetical protein
MVRLHAGQPKSGYDMRQTNFMLKSCDHAQRCVDNLYGGVCRLTPQRRSSAVLLLLDRDTQRVYRLLDFTKRLRLTHGALNGDQNRRRR